MKRLIILCVFLLVVILFQGCGVVRQKQSRNLNDQLMLLQVGMDREEVVTLLGKPYRREMYSDNEFLIYETDHWGGSELKRFTPILLKDGKVVGWGRNYYDDSKKSKIDADIKIETK